jgi:hypothetical protein
MKRFFFLSILFFPAFVTAQKQSYKDVDEFIKAMKMPVITQKNMETVAHQITDKWKSDSLKARAVFDFVATYYDYDYDMIKTGFSKATQEALGVCWQYSQLFCDLADFAGLETRMVYGWSKASYKDINKINKKSYHAWNMVKIDGIWRPLDCTWASGYMDKKTKDFVHDLDPSYFLTNKVVFSLNHHPDSGFQYIAYSAQSMENFHAAPLYLTRNFPKEFYFKPSGAKWIDFTNEAEPKVSFEYEGTIPPATWTYSDIKEKTEFALKMEAKDGIITFTFPAEIGVDSYVSIRYAKKTLVTIPITFS